MKCKDVRVTVVDYENRPIFGHDLFPQLGISVNQSSQIPNNNQKQCPIKHQVALDFRGFISRIGKPFKQTVKSTFHKVSLQLIKKVDKYQLIFNL